MLSGSLNTSRYQKSEVLYQHNYISQNICSSIMHNRGKGDLCPKLSKRVHSIGYTIGDRKKNQRLLTKVLENIKYDEETLKGTRYLTIVKDAQTKTNSL